MQQRLYWILIFGFTITSHLLPAQCNNETQYPAGLLQAPEMEGDVLVISEAQYAGDYSKISGCVTGMSYLVKSSMPTDYVTIRSADLDEVIVHGLTPLTFVSSFDGTVTIHINLSVPPCGEQSVNRTTSMTHKGVFVNIGNLGINISNPTTAVDVKGKIKISNDVHSASTGMMRWNEETNDFEGFDGVKWRSLTKAMSDWGQLITPEATESDKIVRVDDGLLRFANRMKMDDETVIVNASETLFDFQGVALIYQDINDANTEIFELFEPTATPVGSFGNGDLDINNGRAAVGTYSNNGQEERGSVTLYHYVNNDWIMEQVIQPDSMLTGFGYTISLDSSFLAVKASNFKDVYIYKLMNEEWTLSQIVSNPQNNPDHYFGTEVLLHQDRLFISATNRPIDNTVGVVYIYELGDDGDFVLQESIISPSDPTDEQGFGNVIEADGDYVVIGSYKQYYNGNEEKGFVAIYQYDGSEWQEDTVLVSPVEMNEYYGGAIDINGDQLIVNGYLDFFTRDSPNVYVYCKAGNIWNVATKLKPCDSSYSGSYGQNVSIQNNTIVVSDHFYDSAELDFGALYIYRK